MLIKDLAKRIVDVAKKKGKVKAIRLELGELAPILPGELEKALRALVDWDIYIINKQSRTVCPCGFSGQPRIIQREHGFVTYVCPKCHKVPIVVEGASVVLKEVELCKEVESQIQSQV